MRAFILLISTALFLSAETKTIAVLNFSGAGISDIELDVLTSKLEGELVKQDAFNVLEREQMGSILEEQGFQQSGCISSECAIEVGQILGVTHMISGSIGSIEGLYYVKVKLTDVESSKILKQVDRSVEGSLKEVMLGALPEIASELAGNDAKGVEKDKVSSYEIGKSSKSGQAVVDVATFYKHNLIYLDDQFVGTHKSKLTLNAGTYTLTEKSKRDSTVLHTEEVTVAETGTRTIGLGGNRVKMLLGFDLAVVPPGTGSNSLYKNDNIDSDHDYENEYGSLTFASPGISFGLLIRNRHSHTVSTHISIGTYIHDVDIKNMAEDDELDTRNYNSYYGGFYTYMREFSIGKVQLGVGPTIGYRYLKTEYNQFINDVGSGFTSSIYNTGDEAIIRTDFTRKEYGGASVKTGLLFDRWYCNALINLVMGEFEQQRSIHMWDTGSSPYYWSSLDRDGTVEGFSFTPELSFQIGFIL
jgi:hypothetical protein